MEYKQMSLRQCAMADAEKRGKGAVEELKEKWARRRFKAPSGKKTNVGDPNRKR